MLRYLPEITCMVRERKKLSVECCNFLQDVHFVFVCPDRRLKIGQSQDHLRTVHVFHYLFFIIEKTIMTIASYFNIWKSKREQMTVKHPSLAIELTGHNAWWTNHLLSGVYRDKPNVTDVLTLWRRLMLLNPTPLTHYCFFYVSNVSIDYKQKYKIVTFLKF